MRTLLILTVALLFCSFHHPQIDETQNLKLPTGFYLDSIESFDSTKMIRIAVLIPLCRDNKEFNNMLLSNINHQKTDFIADVDTNKAYIKGDEPWIDPSSYSEFVTEPTSVYKDNNLISISLYVSSYLMGAPHPMDEYFSFNYDTKKKMQIKFSDYFLMSNKEDSTFFINAINKAINQKGIGVDKIYDIDFNVNRDTVSFNFDDYEIAGYADGMQQAKVAKKSLTKYIKELYR